MKTNVWSYLEEYNLLRKEILKEINKVFSSGQLILGPKVKLFENKFSKFVKHKYGIGVNSEQTRFRLHFYLEKLKVQLLQFQYSSSNCNCKHWC